MQNSNVLGPCAQGVCHAGGVGVVSDFLSFVSLRGVGRALRLVLGGLLVVTCAGCNGWLWTWYAVFADCA